jgi:hypothetical protein
MRNRHCTGGEPGDTGCPLRRSRRCGVRQENCHEAGGQREAAAAEVCPESLAAAFQPSAECGDGPPEMSGSFIAGEPLQVAENHRETEWFREAGEGIVDHSAEIRPGNGFIRRRRQCQSRRGSRFALPPGKRLPTDSDRNPVEPGRDRIALSQGLSPA